MPSLHPDFSQAKIPSKPGRRAFHLPTFPITSSSHPLTFTEKYAVFNFTYHAHDCNVCKQPHNRIRSTIAKENTTYMYERQDHKIYSTILEHHATVHLELPPGSADVRVLLHAIRKVGESAPKQSRESVNDDTRKANRSAHHSYRAQDQERRKESQQFRTLAL